MKSGAWPNDMLPGTALRGTGVSITHFFLRKRRGEVPEKDLLLLKNILELVRHFEHLRFKNERGFSPA